MNIIFQVQKEEEGGFSAKAIDLPIFTQGDNYDELINNIKDSLNCHFENNYHGTMDMVYREVIG